MQATRRKVSLLLFVLAVFAAISPAAASLGKLPELNQEHQLHQVDVDRLEAAVLDDTQPLAPQAEELTAAPRFSLWWPPPAPHGELLTRALVDTSELAHVAEVASSELPSLLETRVWAFTLFGPESQPASNRVSRGEASSFGLGLVGSGVGRAATSLYAFVGHQPNMGTDPSGEMCVGPLKDTAACQWITNKLTYFIAGDPVARAEREIAHREMVRGATKQFVAQHGRAPRADEAVIWRPEMSVLANGQVNDHSGRIEADHAELALVGGVAAPLRAFVVTRAAGATVLRATGAAALSAGDELVGAATGVNPSSVQQLAKAARNLEFNVAPHGQQPTPRSPYASHHGIQQEYLSQNVPGYSPRRDPTILLEDSPGGMHRTITGEQATFRAQTRRELGSPYGGDYGRWRAEAIEQMQRNGLPNEKIIEWLHEHEGYMFGIGMPGSPPSGGAPGGS